VNNRQDEILFFTRHFGKGKNEAALLNQAIKRKF